MFMINSFCKPKDLPKILTSSPKNSRSGPINLKFIFLGSPPTLWCDFIFDVLLPVDDLLSMISG